MLCKQEVLQTQRTERGFSFTSLTSNQNDEGSHLFQSLPETRKSWGRMNHFNHLCLSQLKRARPYAVEENDDASVSTSLAYDFMRRSQQGITVKYSFFYFYDYLFLCGELRVVLIGFRCHLKYVMWESRLFKIDIC